MSFQLAPVLRQRYLTSGGLPLAGGKLYSYRAGTSTPLSTFTDSTGSTPNANPTILDANGEANIWVDTNSFKFVLTDSNDVTQWTADNVTASGVGATGAAGSQIYSGAGAPSNGLGVNGDFYVDNTGSNTYYVKAGTTWSSQANLKGTTGTTGSTGATGSVGSAGAAGSQIFTGSGVPSGGTGVNGDIYIDSVSPNTYYQKSAGSWASQGTLRGATGSTGGAGSNGSNGTNGANGLLGGYAYLFSTATSSTPTTSTLNFNNAIIASVTNIYINKTNSASIAIGAILAVLTTNCQIIVSDSSGNSGIFTVSGAATLSGNVYTVPVTWVGNSGTLTNASTVSLCIQQIGPAGATGSTGSTGAAGPTGATGASFAYVSQSSTLNPAVIGDYYLLSGASFNITLPTAVGLSGQTIAFRHNGTSLSQKYTFLTTSAQTINGVASGSYILCTKGESIVLVSDNSNWQIVSHSTSSGVTSAGSIVLSATSAYVFSWTGSQSIVIGDTYSDGTGNVFTVSATTNTTTGSFSGTPGTPATTGTLTRVTGTGVSSVAWTSRTITGQPIIGTTTANATTWSRDGRYCTFTLQLAQTALGTNGSGDVLVYLPAGLQIDTTVFPAYQLSVGTALQLVAAAVPSLMPTTGAGWFTTNSQDTIWGGSYPYSATSMRMCFLGHNNSGGGVAQFTWSGANSSLGNATVLISASVVFPVLDWQP